MQGISLIPGSRSVSGGRRAIERFREAEPVQPGDLSLEIDLGISRMVAGLRRENSLYIGEFLADQLIGIREDEETVMLNFIVSGRHGAQAGLTFPRPGEMD